MQMESRASEVVSKSLELKSWQAKKDRLNREMSQKKNISKIHREVERWRSDLEKSLCNREKKVDDLLGEKEKTIAEVSESECYGDTCGIWSEPHLCFHHF